VNAAVDRLAGELRTKYNGKRPLFVGVLNGAFFFAAELMKRLDIECEITFVKVASYLGTSSTGRVTDLIGLERTDRRIATWWCWRISWIPATP
jgi:hypoxanthine-guanine phosphoribosyltransferase